MLDQVIFTNLLEIIEDMCSYQWTLILVWSLFMFINHFSPSFDVSLFWCPLCQFFSSCLIWWPSFPLQMWCHIIRLLLLQYGAATSSESGIPRFVLKLTKMQERKKIHVCAKTFESLHEMLAFEGLGAQKLFCSSNTSGVHT